MNEFEPAVPLPVLPVSDVEKHAIESLFSPNAGLKYDETIVTFIHERSGVEKHDIRLVLNNLAVMQQRSRMDTSDSERRAALIKQKATLTFDQSEPVAVPEFVARQNAAEQKRLESQIAALQERSKPA